MECLLESGDRKESWVLQKREPLPFMAFLGLEPEQRGRAERVLSDENGLCHRRN